MESALTQLGALPQAHQTDHSTAATHMLSAADTARTDATRGYNAGYHRQALPRAGAFSGA